MNQIFTKHNLIVPSTTVQQVLFRFVRTKDAESCESRCCNPLSGSRNVLLGVHHEKTRAEPRTYWKLGTQHQQEFGLYIRTDVPKKYKLRKNAQIQKSFILSALFWISGYFSNILWKAFFKILKFNGNVNCLATACFYLKKRNINMQLLNPLTLIIAREKRQRLTPIVGRGVQTTNK